MERLTVHEAAQYIGASVYKTYQMARLKQIPHYRVGSKIIFRKATLDEWMKKHEEKNSRGLSGDG